MAPKKVRVNSVNPGGVVTNLYKGTSFCPTEEEEKKVGFIFNLIFFST